MTTVTILRHSTATTVGETRQVRYGNLSAIDRHNKINGKPLCVFAMLENDIVLCGLTWGNGDTSNFKFGSSRLFKKWAAVKCQSLEGV